MHAPNAEMHHDDLSWAELIPDQEWRAYCRLLEPALEKEVPFALGGGFAFSYYSRRWRDTKDIDLYILPRDRERMIDLLHRNGFIDLYDEKPYDRKWIYRGVQDGVIIDLIWAMANQRARVDAAWLENAPTLILRGLAVKLLPVEELIWSKLYVLQRDRCDWPDLLNIFNVRGATLKWDHLLAQINGDARLLGGVLSVFSWMCPSRAAEWPVWIWERLGLLPPADGLDCETDRKNVVFLDSRDWFGPTPREQRRDETTPAS